MCACLQTVRVSLALLISAHSCGVWRDAKHWWADSCRYVTKPLLIPCFLHGVRAGSLLARCRQGAGPHCGSSENEVELLRRRGGKRPHWSLRRRNLLSSGLIIRHSFGFTNSSLARCGLRTSLPLLQHLKKHLQRPTRKTRWEENDGFLWCVTYAVVSLLKDLYSFTGLTLFNKPSFYHFWLTIKITIKIWI